MAAAAAATTVIYSFDSHYIKISQMPLTSSTELRSSDWRSLAESDALDGDFTNSSSSSSSAASVPVIKHHAKFI